MNASDIAINLLQRRGFIIEPCSEDIYQLVGPYNEQDIKYLSDILKSAEAGNVSPNGTFVVNNNPDLQILHNLFVRTDERIGGGECSVNRSWSEVMYSQYGHAQDIPVSWLDPYVAYYVRVLALCGLFTASCCDGNHINPKRRTLNIVFDSPIYSTFHRWMWEKYGQSIHIPWHWSKDKAFVKIQDDNASEIYNNLFLSAQLFYEKKDYFIKVRQDAAQRIGKEAAGIMQNEELIDRFISELELVSSKNIAM